MLGHMLEVGQHKPVILFDGVCNLCNASVDFILRRDRRVRFLFAPLQSEAARERLAAIGAPAPKLDSMLLLEDGRLFDRSTAALRIARRLDGLWPLLYALILVPRPVRDYFYDGIARNRYRWFGRRETCRVPTQAERGRFLS